MEDSMLDVKRDYPDAKCLAAIDESRDYEIDAVEIWENNGAYMICSATGCSCWGGEYEVENFNTLQEVIDALDLTKNAGRDEYKYNPSILGARDLIAQLENKPVYDVDL